MKNYKTEFKWAIILVAAVLLWMLLERIVGLHSTHIDKHRAYSNFSYIPIIAIYVSALLDKRKTCYHGKMTYLQGVKSGLIITALLTLLSPLIQYLKITVISPHFFTNAIDYVVDQKTVTLAEARKFFTLGNYIKLSLMATPIMGILLSPIVAIFTIKK